MVKSKSVKTNSEKNVLDDACKIVFNQIEKNAASLKGFVWLKKDLSYDSWSDLGFVYKGNIFSVLIDIQSESGKSSLSEDKISRQIEASEKYNMIPCKFIIFKKGISFSVNTTGFNLIGTVTNKEIDIKTIKKVDSKTVSELFIRYNSINYMQEYLMTRKNKILAVQYLADKDPQLWYMDKLGNKSYVIIKINNFNNDNVFASEIIDKYKNYNGYEAVFLFKMLDSSDPESMLELKIEDYIKINSVASDITVKCKNIEEENVYDLIVSAIQQKNLSDKEIIGVFPIPGHRDFLLKIHNVLVNNIGILSHDLAMIPYKFDDNIKNNPHFGLPLYHIDSKDSEYVKDGFVLPESIIFVGAEYANISIIKKVTGVGIKSAYDYELSLLNGQISDSSVGIDILKLIDIYCKYGGETAELILKEIEQGIYDFSNKKITNLSDEYSFTRNDEFSNVYNSFVDKYLESLDNIAELPQKTFNDAVENIILPKNFVFDFIIPNNTLIDYNKQAFNFIDFRYEKFKVSHTNVYDQIVEFRNVLLGQYNRVTRQVNQLLFRQADIDKYNHYKNIITEKIKNATP